MDPQIEKLTKHIVGLQNEIDNINNTATQNDELLSREQNLKVEELQDQIDNTLKEIGNRERALEQQAALKKSVGRRTDDQLTDAARPAHSPADALNDTGGLKPPPAQPRKPGDLPAHLQDGKKGFKTIGEFALSVKHAAVPGANVDPRLRGLAPTAYANESNGADGGFLVPPDFRKEIVNRAFEDESLVQYCEQLTTSSNSLSVPFDESNPWDASGIQAYWDSEGSLLQQSKPVLTDRQWKLNRMTVLVPITEELMEDAPAMTAHITRNAPQRMRYKLNEAILFGDGVGKPTGALRSDVKVRVAKEGGQAADTLLFENVVKMYSRMEAPSRRRAVWLISQDVEPQMLSMKFPAGSGATVPVYLPPGGLSTTPYATLFGRPVIPLENMRTLGDEGDIAFVDLSQYGLLVKGNGPTVKQDVSMHLLFDYNMSVFRFVMRVGGQPFWSKAKTRPNSAVTLSPFVSLEERA